MVVAASLLIVVSPVSVLAANPDIGGDPIHTEVDYFSAGEWGMTAYSYVFDDTSASVPDLFEGFSGLDPGEMLFVYLLEPAGDPGTDPSISHFAVNNEELVPIYAVGWSTRVVPEGYNVNNHQDPFVFTYSGPVEATVFNYTGNPFDPWCPLDPGEYSLVYYFALADSYGPVSATADAQGVCDNELVPGPMTSDSLQGANSEEGVFVNRTDTINRTSDSSGSEVLGGNPGIGGDPIYTEEDYFSAGDWGMTVYSYVFDNTSTSVPDLFEGFSGLDPGEMLFVYLLEPAGDPSIGYFAVGNPDLVHIYSVYWSTRVVPVGYDVNNHQDPFVFTYSGPVEATVYNYTGNPFDPWCPLDPGEYSLVYYFAESPGYRAVSATADAQGIGDNQFVPGPTTVPPPIPTLEWPLAGHIGDRQVLLGFGDNWTWTYCGGLPKKHTGVDLKASAGEDVYAAYDGIIVKIYDLSDLHNWGKGIIIKHAGFTTSYMHINPISEEGDYVSKGQEIATIANIKGDEHLHFAVRTSTDPNVSKRGALPQKHGSTDFHNGVFTGCKSDPLFPEKFVNPMTLAYESTQPLPPPEVAPRPESENPQPDSLAFDAPLVIFPVEPPSWYGEQTWRGAAIRLLDRVLPLLFRWLPPIIVVPIEGVQAHEWKGDNATAITVAVAAANQTQTDAIKLTEASDAFIWREVTIPENAYGLTFDGIFPSEADGDNLIVSFDEKTLFIDDGTLFSDSLWANPGIIYIGDLAGQMGILQFRLKSESDPNMSILIHNIAFTTYPKVGDLDSDMDVDQADLATLCLHWLEQDCNYPGWCEGTDLNYNGFVDFIDFGLFAENWLWETIRGDFDIDGDVDFEDFAIFSLAWLTADGEAGYNPACDISIPADGLIDWRDLDVFAANWLLGK